MRKVIILLFTLLTSNLVAGNCQLKNTHHHGICSYHVECVSAIRGLKLSKECLGASNYNTTIDILVSNATPDLGVKPDQELIFESITSLTVTGYWPQTNLTFLENMYRLKKLIIFNSKIRQINGRPFRNLGRLEGLSLNRNGLTNVDNLFQFDSRPIWLKSLSLSFNAITDISKDTFIELCSLIELDLSHNHITKLTEEPFSNLTHLQILRLNNNFIKDLNGALNGLFNLKHLYLKHNEIDNINPESLTTINHLETFDISHNQLENLRPIVFTRHWYHFGDHSVCKMIVSGNYIKHLRNTTSDDVNRPTRNPSKNRVDVYTELDMSNNSISHIEFNAFESMIQLTTLDLSINKLSVFIVNPDHMRYIKYLNLSSNYLRKLHYQSFSSMHSLQNLDLSNNEIDNFPDHSLSDSNDLKLINLTYNNILSISSLRITFHDGGGILDLSNNGLSTLSIPQNDAYRLRELVLSFNNISDAYLIKLKNQRSLTHLHMANNIIQELDENSLQLPMRLMVLDISFNEIQKIGPSSFHNVPHLTRLRLSHNFLKEIEYGAFTGLTVLEDLDLSYNDIKMLDSNLLLDLRYLRSLSLRHNGMIYLDDKAWYAHKYDLTIYLDDNNFNCEWLAKTLNDFNSGYTRMRPTVLTRTISGHNIDGIPCEQESNNLVSRQNNYMTDERLLVTSQKILEAVLQQSSYLQKMTKTVEN